MRKNGLPRTNGIPSRFFYNQDKKFNSKLEVTTIPTTFVLSPSGQIIFKKVGSEGEKILQDLDAMIDYTKRKF